MPGLIITLPIAVVIAVSFLGLFFWSVRNGEHEDSEMTGHRILYDEEQDVDREIGKPK